MKRNRLEKLGDFVLGKGFYIVLFLCVAAIGISGYYLIRSVSGSEPAQEPVTANPSVTLPDSSAVFPGEQSHQPQPTPEPAAQPDDPQPKKDAETAAPAQPREVVYTWPVKGQVLRGFTVEALAYDETMGDWLEEIAQQFPDAFFEELDGGIQLEEQARAEKEKGDLARERPDPDDCRAPRLKGGPGLVSGIAWHTRVDEPEPGAEIIIIDDSGFVDSNVYIGAGDVKEPGVRWDEVALWTQMPDGPTGTPGTVVPPENGWVPLQFVKGMECPPSDGKYYCRFDCDGTVITQVAWWDGFSKSWSFKKAGAKIDAKCMGWFPLPDENL